ncbi:hypothetical protein JKP88DRAFT_350518 [Tribonema minus]|uniref:Ankyrin repeat domain-containing protein n=1 Tax=Tribonema minus TaxID=303371 RepID=A0A835YNS1_9STRA|nr:hypothetical protein JKP88DRAFT_350518 [Tribonema minus]
METRLSEVTEATRSEGAGPSASVRSRSEAEGGGDGQQAVLTNPPLLEAILSFVGCGQWLYLASVAHSWRTAYMSVTARRQGVPWVCVTAAAAVAEAPARLEMGLACGVRLPARGGSFDVEEAAGASGSTEVIRRMRQLGMSAAGVAAECGEHMTLQTWIDLVPHILCDAYDGAQQEAALIWLSQHARPWPVWYCTHLCFTAAENGQLAALKFLMRDDRGQALFGPLIPDPSVVDTAGPEWRHAPGYSFEHNRVGYQFTLMDKAAVGGNVEVLRWLRQEHALPFTPFTMRFAAEKGHLAALKWLHAAGCPHDVEDLCARSFRALADTPGVTPSQMEWLRSLGGSWSRQTATHALLHLLRDFRNTAAVQWLRREGAEWPELNTVVNQFDHCDDFVAEALVDAARQGCPWGRWTPTHCRIVSRGRYSIIKPLHAAGCPCECD